MIGIMVDLAPKMQESLQEASMTFRKETDSMGEVKVPAEALWGAQSERARQNFTVSQRKFDRRFIRALGLIKGAAAEANADLGKLDAKLAKVIVAKSAEVADGKHDAHFPLDIFQTGSGTSTNMNANEVITNLSNVELGVGLGAKKPVHPNDHVNMGQSSNDVIPTAIHVGAAVAMDQELLPALKNLQKALGAKAKEFADIVKIGRTHLQDATPVTLGQEFSGYATQITHGIFRVQLGLEGLLELAIGGTAVGTGINTDPKFAGKVCSILSKKTGLKFREAENHFEAQAAKDAAVFASGALKTVAVSLMKIANDLRWLASGPMCGLGEILLPELQPGSSIMPGKINPVIPEMTTQVAAQVIGNDAVITVAGQAGNFELHVMMPPIAANLLESIEILARASQLLADKCVAGITANRKRCEELTEKSLALVTSLAPVIGYDKAAALAKKAYKDGKTIRELLKAEKILPDAKINELLDARTMLAPK